MARGRSFLVRLIAAALLALGGMGLQAPARPVAATDCVTYYCATMTVSFIGNGYARAVDNQGDIDCYDNGGSTSGTCSVQYYWIGESSPKLTVTLTVYANANSYVCNPQASCTQAGGTATATYDLARDASQTYQPEVQLAKALTITMQTSGDGDGRITSSPSGIDCSVAHGASSGTCTHTWYFTNSMSVSFTSTPTPGNYVCSVTPLGNLCESVGQGLSSSVGPTSSSDASTLYFEFDKGHPILTVGVTGQGTVVSSPSGISCPNTCSKYFPPNSNVTLNAAAKSGSVFQRWTGACSGYGSSCNLSLGSTDVSTTAVFGSPATPTPTTLPHPTGTPKPGSTPTPTSRPNATTTPQASGSPTFAAPTNAPPSAAASDAAASQAVQPEPSPFGSATPTDAAASGPATGSPAPGTPGGAPGGTSTVALDPFILVLFALLVLVALGIGLVVGRRGRRDSGPAVPPAT